MLNRGFWLLLLLLMFLAVLTLPPAGAARGGNVGCTSTGMFAQLFLDQFRSFPSQSGSLQEKCIVKTKKLPSYAKRRVT
jgi:hypothetical protein